MDLFEKQAEEKKERVAKNELQRLRNLARASGMKKVPGIGATPSEKPSKLELGRQFLTAKKVRRCSTILIEWDEMDVLSKNGNLF